MIQEHSISQGDIDKIKGTGVRGMLTKGDVLAFVRAREAQLEAAKEAKERPETDRQREEIRAWIRAQMDEGELSWEPEVELEKSERRAAARVGKSMPSLDGAAQKKGKGAKDGSGAEASSAKNSKPAGIAGDEFFSADEDDDEIGEEAGSDEDVDMADASAAPAKGTSCLPRQSLQLTPPRQAES